MEFMTSLLIQFYILLKFDSQVQHPWLLHNSFHTVWDITASNNYAPSAGEGGGGPYGRYWMGFNVNASQEVKKYR